MSEALAILFFIVVVGTVFVFVFDLLFHGLRQK
jgi:hypothetical protein